MPPEPPRSQKKAQNHPRGPQWREEVIISDRRSFFALPGTEMSGRGKARSQGRRTPARRRGRQASERLHGPESPLKIHASRINSVLVVPDAKLHALNRKPALEEAPTKTPPKEYALRDYPTGFQATSIRLLPHSGADGRPSLPDFQGSFTFITPPIEPNALPGMLAEATENPNTAENGLKPRRQSQAPFHTRLLIGQIKTPNTPVISQGRWHETFRPGQVTYTATLYRGVLKQALDESKLAVQNRDVLNHLVTRTAKLEKQLVTAQAPGLVLLEITRLTLRQAGHPETPETQRLLQQLEQAERNIMVSIQQELEKFAKNQLARQQRIARVQENLQNALNISLAQVTPQTRRLVRGATLAALVGIVGYNVARYTPNFPQPEQPKAPASAISTPRKPKFGSSKLLKARIALQQRPSNLAKAKKPNAKDQQELALETILNLPNTKIDLGHALTQAFDGKTPEELGRTFIDALKASGLSDKAIEDILQNFADWTVSTGTLSSPMFLGTMGNGRKKKYALLAGILLIASMACVVPATPTPGAPIFPTMEPTPTPIPISIEELTTGHHNDLEKNGFSKSIEVGQLNAGETPLAKIYDMLYNYFEEIKSEGRGLYRLDGKTPVEPLSKKDFLGNYIEPLPWVVGLQFTHNGEPYTLIIPDLKDLSGVFNYLEQVNVTYPEGAKIVIGHEDDIQDIENLFPQENKITIQAIIPTRFTRPYLEGYYNLNGDETPEDTPKSKANKYKYLLVQYDDYAMLVRAQYGGDGHWERFLPHNAKWIQDVAPSQAQDGKTLEEAIYSSHPELFNLNRPEYEWFLDELQLPEPSY